ncbi:amidohydrolase family protein [Paenibacillus tarimensis]|uniref:amidohydrolase family protein n=1 Tax=Paenibacillus tarimensis TaxID=416012 RepID=UPI001F333CF7|nr:amidohydrolase family protein [Paenibacillus tarimensis]MCF2944864.1 amidohydrolase family protein [Paenibacillus tarimensis]
MRIDAHQHYWSIERGDYGWITPDIPVLYRDYLPEHLKPELARHRIDRTILVQAAPTEAETEYMLGLAERYDSIGGVVGWLDPAEPACLSQCSRLRQHPKLVGFRVMIQEMKDAAEWLTPLFIEHMSYLAKQKIPVDLLVTASQLNDTLRLLEQAPGLQGVLDHLGKPRIAAGELEPWRSQLAEVAAHPGMYCKLSGMVTEADHQAWQPDDFVPYVRHAAEVFGPYRVMFGSDWPVCRMAAEYGDVVNVLLSALPGSWGEPEYDRLFGLNAKEFYQL